MNAQQLGAGILAILLWGETSVMGSSFVLQNCDCGGCLRASVKSGYRGPRCCPADFGTGTNRCEVKLIREPMKSTLARHLQHPAYTSCPSDVADIRGRSRFFYADPAKSIPYDTVRFTFIGEAGATDSRNASGNLAWARVCGTDAFKFHTGPAVCEEWDDCLGYMQVGPLRTMRPFETVLRVDVLEDGKVVHRTNAGGRAVSMQLMEDTTYEVRLIYAMAVPPQDDPKYRVDHWVRLIPRPIPDPSAGFLLFGAAPLLLRRCRTATTSLPAPR